MPPLEVISLTPHVNEWMANTRHPRILHIFNRACNLINEQREVLSIVTPQIGSGPFNLVVERDFSSAQHLSLQSQVSSSNDQVSLGDLSIHTANAKLWNPRPDWERLHARRDDISKQLAQLPIPGSIKRSGLLSSQSLVSNLSVALVDADIPSAHGVTSQLAGLGAGLTPAGDDVITGALYAVWIIHPQGIARTVAAEIADAAAPLTTSLSAAWLRSAGRGEAGGGWHRLFDALISADAASIQLEVARLLSIGHTSGADALTGFLGTLRCWAASSKIELFSP